MTPDNSHINHPLWRDFEDYMVRQYGFSHETMGNHWSKAVWWRDWQIFLAGAVTENKRIRDVGYKQETEEKI